MIISCRRLSNLYNNRSIENLINPTRKKMAKVTGPLMSLSASGKIANTIVFAGWKGVQYARQYVIPANPQSEGQGDQRIMMGGTGRACGKVSVSGTFNTKLAALDVVPAGQSKQSYLVKYILDHYLDSVTNYEAQLALLTGHTAYTSFQTGATALGINDFDLSYATTESYDRGLGLFLLAKTAQALGFTGEPYSTALTDWTGADIDLMVADM